MTERHTCYAGFWRRLAAALIDFLLVTACGLCALLVWSGITQHANPWDSPATPLNLGIAGLLAFLLGLWLDARLQGTPGKRLLDCLVVDVHSGGPVSFTQSLRRGLAMPLSALPAGLGFFRIGWNRRKQGWHDRLSDTVVIIEDEAGKSLAELAGMVQ
ncbi:MAG: RDD family protein [Gammaproteobacteria bacterium]